LLLKTSDIVIKNLAAFEKTDVDKMVLSYMGDTKELYRSDKKWFLTKEKDIADQKTADRILSKFLSYRAKEFIKIFSGNTGSDKDYGFDNNSLVALFIGKTGAPIGKVVFGKKTGTSDIFTLGGPMGTYLYRADISPYEKITKDYKNVRNQKLFTGDKNLITSLKFVKEGGSVTLIKSKEEDKKEEVWKVKYEGDSPPYDKKSTKDEIKEDAEKVISFITSDKIDAFVDTFTKEKSAMYFSPKHSKGILEVALSLGDTERILFGKTTADSRHAFVRVGSRYPLYKVLMFDLDPILEIFSTGENKEGEKEDER
jgi:hypothetical protein